MDAKPNVQSCLFITMSSNGKYQSVTVPDSNFIWTSNDYGHSWIQKITAQNFLGVIISSDGNIQTALGSNGYIFASSDYGNTWIQQATFKIGHGLPCLKMGKYKPRLLMMVISGDMDLK